MGEIRRTSRRGSIIAHAWLWGGGLVGTAGALTVFVSVPVTSEIVGALLGGGGALLGSLIGGWIGLEREDRYERRRLGITGP